MPDPYDQTESKGNTTSMRLKELEIQGFKSFPDKTKISIGQGTVSYTHLTLPTT